MGTVFLDLPKGPHTITATQRPNLKPAEAIYSNPVKMRRRRPHAGAGPQHRAGQATAGLKTPGGSGQSATSSGRDREAGNGRRAGRGGGGQDGPGAGRGAGREPWKPRVGGRAFSSSQRPRARGSEASAGYLRHSCSSSSRKQNPREKSDRKARGPSPPRVSTRNRENEDESHPCGQERTPKRHSEKTDQNCDVSPQDKRKDTDSGLQEQRKSELAKLGNKVPELRKHEKENLRKPRA